MNRLKYILQHNYFIKILALFTILLSVVYIYNFKRTSIYTNEEIFIGIVNKLKVKDNKTVIYINSKEKLLINYFSELKDINLGDKIKVTGKLVIPNNNTIPNLFNYRKYLLNEGILYTVTASKIEKISNNTNIIYHIRKKIQNRISKIDNVKEYLSIFILGNNSLIDEDTLKSYRSNGISHLFSISGMHISLFASFLLYFLKRLSYSNFYNYTIIIIFLLFYILLIGKPISAIRSLIMYLLSIIDKLLNLKTSKINLALLVLIIMLIYNPYYLVNTSFQYSFLISFSLILYHKRIKEHKKLLSKYLYISFISFLISFPITIYNSFEINILSVILNTILVPFISLIVFPLALITFIIPIISNILKIIITILESVSLFIYENKIGLVIFSKPNIIIVLIYYLFIYLFLYNYKYFYIFILIIANKLYPYLNDTAKLTTLDVGQGDSIVLTLPHSITILIDTGGNSSSNYNISDNKLIPYLKSNGITKIKYLILTHGDYDHMGEAINLVENFKVEKVIFNCGEFNDLEKELIKVLDKKKIKYYSCIKELNINNNKFYFLQTKEYDNENDNSNVIYTEINGYKFMFMGDAGINKEKDILDKYNISDIDVLKVGHHGSKTSSGKSFIKAINPKYGVISVGNNNRYGHPNIDVLNNLENSKIYRTDQDGSIMFKIKNNKLKIETCSP